jgi:hypothetical protein
VDEKQRATQKRENCAKGGQQKMAQKQKRWKAERGAERSGQHGKADIEDRGRRLLQNWEDDASLSQLEAPGPTEADFRAL